MVGYGPFSFVSIHNKGLCHRGAIIRRNRALNKIKTYIHTTHALFPKKLAEASQILLPDSHVIPKLLMRNTTDVTGGKPIAI
jgi:hypothetical protein